jgi:Tfp pilus assembly protein PilV
MKRASARGDHAFWLIEAMLAVAIFAVGVLALGGAIHNCLIAQHLAEDDVRARLALSNRMAEIEAGSVTLADSTTEDLKGAFEGMKLKQTRQLLKRQNEKKQDITGIYAVTLQVTWTADGQELSRELPFYVYPRQQR